MFILRQEIKYAEIKRKQFFKYYLFLILSMYAIFVNFVFCCWLVDYSPNYHRIPYRFSSQKERKDTKICTFIDNI